MRYDLDIQRDDSGVLVTLRAFDPWELPGHGVFLGSGFNEDGDTRAAIAELRRGRSEARRTGSPPHPTCGHSACRQNWIDTAETDCVTAEQV